MKKVSLKRVLKTPQALLAAVLAATMVVPVAVVTATQASAAAQVNNNAGFIQVYTLNIENVCISVDTPQGPVGQPADWKDVVHAMKNKTYTPDLFLVQQVSSLDMLQDIADYMSGQLAGTYQVAALADDWPANPLSGVASCKKFQTNGIIYRTGRFAVQWNYTHGETWSQVDSTTTPACTPTPNTQDRTKGVAIRLEDLQAPPGVDRAVTAASVHWPAKRESAGLYNKPCGADNSWIVDHELSKSPFKQTHIRIVGGDMNLPDGPSPTVMESWWSFMKNSGWADPIKAACETGGSSAPECWGNGQHWTFDRGNGTKDRLDYLWGSRGAGGLINTSAAGTITFNEANTAAAQYEGSDDPANYSEHRAVYARFHY